MNEEDKALIEQAGEQCEAWRRAAVALERGEPAEDLLEHARELEENSVAIFQIKVATSLGTRIQSVIASFEQLLDRRPVMLSARELRSFLDKLKREIER